MRRADNLSFAVIIGLIFICAAMEFKLRERKLELMPLKLPLSGRGEEVKLEMALDELLAEVGVDPLPARNPFKPPDRLLGRGGEEEGERMSRKTIELKLTAICWSPEKPMAVINGRIFEEGKVDPDAKFEVEKIDPDRVIIRSPSGERITLKLGEVVVR